MATTCPHCNADVKGWIPEDRLSEMAKAKREATTESERLAAELSAATAKATTADNLAVELAEARGHAEALTQSHAQQLAVYRHGITDAEDVADIMAIYERRAPKGTDLGDWLGSDSLPRSVSALMANRTGAAAPAPVAPVDPGTVAAPPIEASPAATGTAPANGHPSPVAPSTGNGIANTANAGAVPTPPARAQATAAEIANMPAEQYKAHRDVLLASLTTRGPTV